MARRRDCHDYVIDLVEFNVPTLCVHDAYVVNKKHKQLTTELNQHHREQVI